MKLKRKLQGQSNLRKQIERRPQKRQKNSPHHRTEAEAPSEREISATILQEARQQTGEAIKNWLAPSIHLKHQLSHQNATLQLDPWQKEAFDALVQGHSVVVDAPTTAGKTRVVEAFFQDQIRNPSFRAAYTTPVKSLANDKLREFRMMFGSENVGISTGDIKENLGAPIVVATLESYRNSLLGIEPDLSRTLVVFDEYHYVQDEGRGSAWEEAMILTPKTCQILLLSASVANADEFRSWLIKLNQTRPCDLVEAGERPVPLVNLVWYADDWYLPESLPLRNLKSSDTMITPQPLGYELLVKRLAKIEPLKLTPCIIYAGRRLSCEILAKQLAKHLPPLEEAQRAAIGNMLEAAHRETQALRFMTPEFRHMLQVQGVGYHHSGLTPPVRIAIEMLVKNGLLRFCTATMGLSLGINFSVRSALISDFKRPSELGLIDYSASEVLQMLGRAGRRGRDAVGFSMWPSIESYEKLVDVKREKCYSRLRGDPTTFLGLIGRGYSIQGLETFYSHSFMQHQREEYNAYRKTHYKKETPGHNPAPPEEPTAVIPTAGFPLTMLHTHLKTIDTLTKDDTLTRYGSIARFFPQAGGLLFAKFLVSGKFDPTNLAQAAELAGALALQRFKEPGHDPRYRFPFEAAVIEEELMRLYPYKLFSELYDLAGAKRNIPILREFNPIAGYIVREWIKGADWRDLSQRVATEYFGQGDIMSLLYRVATYIQAMIQADLPELTAAAQALREVILREPLAFALKI